jgi:flagellar biosynthetic protein FliQ
MDEFVIIELARNTLITALIIVTPALLVGMSVGLAMSLFQTVTSLQEQTLAMVPKILAVVTAILLLMPWILNTLRDFAAGLFANLAQYGLPPNP